MRTLIIYATSHGCTAEAAAVIRERLGEGCIALDVKDDPGIDLGVFDAVVAGGSIHAGRVQRRLRKFLEANAPALMEKRLGLYLCCMYEGEKAQEQFENAFPASLREHATARGFFGGVLDFERMNFIERAIVRKVEGVTETVRKVDEAAIEEFAGAMAVG
jgi:menaquinone-dependent protoporphyrinogen oxidase